jgi:hypothetical protein
VFIAALFAARKAAVDAGVAACPTAQRGSSHASALRSLVTTDDGRSLHLHAELRCQPLGELLEHVFPGCEMASELDGLFER